MKAFNEEIHNQRQSATTDKVAAFASLTSDHLASLERYGVAGGDVNLPAAWKQFKRARIEQITIDKTERLQKMAHVLNNHILPKHLSAIWLEMEFDLIVLGSSVHLFQALPVTEKYSAHELARIFETDFQIIKSTIDILCDGHDDASVAHDPVDACSSKT